MPGMPNMPGIFVNVSRADTVRQRGDSCRTLSFSKLIGFYRHNACRMPEYQVITMHLL